MLGPYPRVSGMGTRELTAYMPFEVRSRGGKDGAGPTLNSVVIVTPSRRLRAVTQMHVKIAYYSRKGTTEGLAGMVAKGIRGRGHQVTTVPIKHRKKPGFLGAGRASMTEREMDLANVEADYDLGDADLIVVGGPIFAGKVNPYTRTFLGRASGMEGKPGGVFISCASKPSDGEVLVNQLVDLASAKGLRVRAKLVGSNKVRDQYQHLADTFVADLLDTAPAEVGGDAADNGDDGGDGDGGNGGDGE